MSTIEQPRPLPAERNDKKIDSLNYQPVADLEALGWQIVGTASVTAADTDLLLEHAREVTPAKLFEGPVLAVAPDGTYMCMRKPRAGFASFRKQADR
jgi:hypothetical protein